MAKMKFLIVVAIMAIALLALVGMTNNAADVVDNDVSDAGNKKMAKKQVNDVNETADVKKNAAQGADQARNNYDGSIGSDDAHTGIAVEQVNEKFTGETGHVDHGKMVDKKKPVEMKVAGETWHYMNAEMFAAKKKPVEMVTRGNNKTVDANAAYDWAAVRNDHYDDDDYVKKNTGHASVMNC